MNFAETPRWHGRKQEFYHVEIELRKKEASYSVEQDVCRHSKERRPYMKCKFPAENCVLRIEVLVSSHEFLNVQSTCQFNDRSHTEAY
jgi:hypothetical protein